MGLPRPQKYVNTPPFWLPLLVLGHCLDGGAAVDLGRLRRRATAGDGRAEQHGATGLLQECYTPKEPRSGGGRRSRSPKWKKGLQSLLGLIGEP